MTVLPDHRDLLDTTVSREFLDMMDPLDRRELPVL
jgi:hypothetical protein